MFCFPVLFPYYLLLNLRVICAFYFRIISVYHLRILYVYSSVYYFRNICVYISVFPPSIISVIFASTPPSFPRPLSSMFSVYSFCCIFVVLPSIISVSSKFLCYFCLFLRVICVHISVLFPPTLSELFPLYYTLIIYAFVPYYLCLYFRNDFRLPCPYYFRICCVHINSALFASVLPYLSAQFPSILFGTFAFTSPYAFRPLFPYYLRQFFRRLFPPILSVLFPSYVCLLS